MLHFSVCVTDLSAASGGGGANKVVTRGTLTAKAVTHTVCLGGKAP